MSNQDWIPVSVRLPDESGTYIVTAMDGKIVRVTYAVWQNRLKTWDLTGRRTYWKITAWMEFPEPYDETGKR